MKHEDLKVLKEVFGSVSEAPTAIALTSPTNTDRDSVLRAIREVPTKALLKDVAVVMGSKVCDHLEAMGFRPADFSDLIGIGEAALEKLREALRKKEESEAFHNMFVETIKGRG